MASRYSGWLTRAKDASPPAPHAAMDNHAEEIGQR
jgi:hypothetical protein